MQATLTRDKQINSESSQLDSDSSQYLTFSLADELFAVGILVIKEIIQYGQLTTVPLMPPYVRGVINLRGAVVPVIDLYARFGQGNAAVGKRTCIVILEVANEGEAQDIGIMVDAVSAVIDIPADQIEPAPTFGSSVRTDFIQGIGKINDQFVIILDVDRTFSVNELAVIEVVRTADNLSAKWGERSGKNESPKNDAKLTDSMVQLVQESWKSVAEIAPKAAELFYQNLFSLDPSLQLLFRGDMTEQGAKLMQMIGLAVSKLKDLDTLVPVLQSLGKRHVPYGVKNEHYETVGAALLTTLAQGLGNDFTPTVKDAWTNVYGVMAKVMTEAAAA